MQEVGLTATEFGPEGFLPPDPRPLLATYGLQALGGFVPVILHRPEHDPVPGVDAMLDGFLATGADPLVLAAAPGQEGYDARPALDAGGWQRLLTNLDRLDELASARGVKAVLHPHVGTMVEQGPEVERVLDGSGIALCLDTGHLLIGGTDPVRLAGQAGERIAHVHPKDVDGAVAGRGRGGELTHTA